MEFFVHLLTEPDHLMWILGMIALITGKATKWSTATYAVVGLTIIVGHALITGA